MKDILEGTICAQRTLRRWNNLVLCCRQMRGMIMGAAASTDKDLCRSGAGQSRSSAGIKLTSNCSMLVVEISYSEHHVV
ncbi:hypothetical protein ERO13_A10G132200v2 [Gossypium hirsutum]|uniref:Uncharacterized protein n=2 Tax=Gossypium TaxID=3633 RepID=A0A5D2NSL5_GOSTO|nr:hypothetical protein ERO13_A10G132200v2 [Gossypium hirsutum]TYG98951.1 hypothetical protein ES288_A10G158200v1 [Gossypium darwinii]TYI06403.1 hypothetical protein ES332_A10G157000v1 [Gossypium tomentosum]